MRTIAMKRRSTLWTATVALMLLPCAARATPEGTIKERMRLKAPSIFENVGARDGLPALTVNDIVQDENGFLWFGTQSGLARYDGVNMRVFRSAEAPGSLTDSYITALAIDNQDRLWVGTLEGGLCLLQASDGTFRCLHPEEDGLPSEAVLSLYASDEAIWAGSDVGRITRISPDTLATKIYQVTDEPSEITALAGGPGGELWAGTRDQGLLRIDPATGDVRAFHHSNRGNSLAAETVHALLFVGETLWIGTSAGLDRRAKSGRGFEHVALDGGPPDEVTALLRDTDQSLWVGTRAGLVRIDDAGDITRFRADPADPNALPTASVTTAFQSRDGVRWFSTIGGGLSKVDNTRLAFGLRTMGGSTFYETDGGVWMGSVPGSLSFVNFARGTRTLYTHLALVDGGSLELARHWITAIQGDDQGLLWIGTRGAGLVAFDPRTEIAQRVDLAAAIGSDTVIDTIWCIVRDRGGAINLATWGHGLIRVDPSTQTFRAFSTTENALSSDHLYDVFEDINNDGVLWLGTAAGLTRLDTKTGAVNVWVHDPGDSDSLSHDTVTSVLQTADGIVWIGTWGGGLNRLDPQSGTLEVIENPDGESPDVVLGMLADATGNLWLTTNGQGLVRFNPKTGAFRYYDHRDGVLDEYSTFAQGLGTRSGLLYFGGPGAPGGFLRFDPADVHDDTFAPPVVLTSFKIFDKPVDLDKPIWKTNDVYLSYKESVLSLEFAALSFASPERMRFAYKLEGLQDDWVETDRRFVTYANLDDGDYVFRVRATNADGVSSEKAIALAIHVAPQPWETWWAYTIYGLLILALGVAVWRYQRQKLKNLARENRLAVAERDLALTGAVQAGFLPKFNRVERPTMNLAALYQPAEACGGDWWWHEQNHPTHWIVVGDVTGHGPGPAMVTAATAAAFRVQADIGMHDFEQRMRNLNTEVLRAGEGRYHMTMTAISLNEQTGEYRFYSAGGLPVLCLQSDGRIRSFPCPGTPLGTADFKLGQVAGTLSPRDRLLVLTDGIPELPLPNGKLLGMRRISRILKTTQTMPTPEAVAYFLREALGYRGNAAQDDDWTLAVIDWMGPGQSEPIPGGENGPAASP